MPLTRLTSTYKHIIFAWIPLTPYHLVLQYHSSIISQAYFCMIPNMKYLVCPTAVHTLSGVTSWLFWYSRTVFFTSTASMFGTSLNCPPTLFCERGIVESFFCTVYGQSKERHYSRLLQLRTATQDQKPCSSTSCTPLFLILDESYYEILDYDDDSNINNNNNARWYHMIASRNETTRSGEGSLAQEHIIYIYFFRSCLTLILQQSTAILLVSCIIL